jgi:hypothetical protein
MLKFTDIVVYADVLALKTEIESTDSTRFGTVLYPLAHAAIGLCLPRIEQNTPALAFLLVVYQPGEMPIISFLRQSFNAILANSKVAGLVIVDSGVEDGGIHAADIANVLQVAVLE